MAVRSVHFRVNAEKPRAQAVRGMLAEAAARVGISEAPPGEADVIVTLGGDGTLLRAVHEFPGSPVLGLNLGGLGYLANVGESEFEAAVAMLAEGRYKVSERRLIEADGRFPALNDIVVTRETGGHAARFELRADGRLVTEYMADGLIFATPTGSTAYSLAAGGPVLMPDSGSFVVTPINPHALGVRPLVVSDEVRFEVTVRSRTAGNAMTVGVYADGENVAGLEEGRSAVVARSERTARFVELDGYDPYGVLARKLGWSGSNVK